MREHLRQHPGSHDSLQDALPAVLRRLNSFPPGEHTGEIGPGDHLLPDPPVTFTVSFHAHHNPGQVTLVHDTTNPAPVHLHLPLRDDVSHDLAAGIAVLASRPVLEVLRRDEFARPEVAWIADLDVTATWPKLPGDAVVWHVAASSRLVNIGWKGQRPYLYVPDPADGNW